MIALRFVCRKVPCFAEDLNFLRNSRIIASCFCFYACFFRWDFSFGRARTAMSLHLCGPLFFAFSFPLFFARSDIFSCRSIICRRIRFLGISSIYFSVTRLRRSRRWQPCAFCLNGLSIPFRGLKLFFRCARDFTPSTFRSGF